MTNNKDNGRPILYKPIRIGTYDKPPTPRGRVKRVFLIDIHREEVLSDLLLSLHSLCQHIRRQTKAHPNVRHIRIERDKEQRVTFRQLPVKSYLPNK